MRVNLYGALLNYLNIVNLKPSPAEPEEDVNTTYVSRLDSSKARPAAGREESCLKSMVVDVISGFGDNLCSIVCGDCIGECTSGCFHLFFDISGVSHQSIKFYFLYHLVLGGTLIPY